MNRLLLLAFATACFATPAMTAGEVFTFECKRVRPSEHFGFLSKPPFDFFPELDPFKVAHLFEWEMEEPSAVCRIWTNQEFTKAFVSYAAD
jgi:hypothetical protein